MDGLTEKTLDIKNVYQGQIINLQVKEVELPDGERSVRELAEHQPGAAVVTYQQGKVILVKQFRTGAEEVLYELPAGLVEAGEAPAECAQRELAEETGYQANSLEKICQFYTSPGFTNEVLHIYLATDLIKSEQNMDKHEFVEVEELELREVENKLTGGQFKDAKTIIGLQHLLNNLNKNN